MTVEQIMSKIIAKLKQKVNIEELTLNTRVPRLLSIIKYMDIHDRLQGD